MQNPISVYAKFCQIFLTVWYYDFHSLHLLQIYNSVHNPFQWTNDQIKKFIHLLHRFLLNPHVYYAINDHFNQKLSPFDFLFSEL